MYFSKEAIEIIKTLMIIIASIILLFSGLEKVVIIYLIIVIELFYLEKFLEKRKNYLKKEVNKKDETNNQ